MPVVCFPKPPNLWEECCEEVRLEREAAGGALPKKTDPGLLEYDPAKVTPVLCGYGISPFAPGDEEPTEYDPAVSHPAMVGRYVCDTTADDDATPTVTKQAERPGCRSANELLEQELFPVLLPGMEEMLREAKRQRCFERKRTKFNAIDFLTEYLYKNNPARKAERENITLLDIPFVAAWLAEHPRAPLPLSLTWSDEEAATVIQSFFRGYIVRRRPETQELRMWQRQWREENRKELNDEMDKFFSRASSASNSRPQSYSPSRKNSASQRRVFPGLRPRTSSARLLAEPQKTDSRERSPAPGNAAPTSTLASPADAATPVLS